jgi:hypothetical protein
MKTLLSSLILAVLAVVLVFSSNSFAEEQGKVRIENGVIYFPEANAPTVTLEEVKTNFPPDSPKEILAIQGKIYAGKIGKESSGRGVRSVGPMQYLIPLGYDPGTKTIRLLKMTANEGTTTKPSKYIIEGVYNGSEGGDLKRANYQTATPELLRFYIKPMKQGYKLYIFWHTGSDVDLLPVAELPTLLVK